MDEPDATIGVLIVDDHAGYRSIAAEVVQATAGFSLAGSSPDRAQTLALVRSMPDQVDLVLLDVHLGADDGLQLAAELVRGQVHPDVLLVSTVAFDDLPDDARRCGARGYLPKAELSPLALSEVGQGVYDWPNDNATRGTRR